jgi:hypothetical protein
MNLLITRKSGIYSLTDRMGGGIATRYGLYGTEFEPWWRQEVLSFPYTSHWTWGRHSLLYNGYRLPGRGVDHPRFPSAEIKNEWSYTSVPPLCLLWRVVGLSAERMLASQEACPLGLHYYYRWIGICNSLYTGGADNVLGGRMGFLFFKRDECYLFSRHAVGCHLPPV